MGTSINHNVPTDALGLVSRKEISVTLLLGGISFSKIALMISIRTDGSWDCSLRPF